MLRTLIHFLSRWWGRRRPAVAIRPRRHTTLQVEALEDRWVPSTIAGYVYHDPTDNGIFTQGSGFSGQTIQLQDQNGNVIDSTFTDSNGHYQFTNDPRINTNPQTITQALDFPSQTTGQSQSLSINQFDPSLGTLTGVDILNNGTMLSSFKFENLDGAGGTVTGNVSETLTLTANGTAISPLVTDLNAQPDTLSVGSFDGSIDFTGNSGHDFGQQTTAGSQSLSLNASQNLSAFIGTGKVSMTEAASSNSSATGLGNIVQQFGASASAHVQVVYHYLPGNGLPPGHYKIFEVQTPTGYQDDKVTVGHHLVDVDTSTGDKLNVNFGALKPASLAGFDYYDANNNGVMQTGSGISGVTIQLTGTDDTGAAVSQTQTTGGDGSYSFTNLRPGSYTLTQATTPGGFINGIDTPGTQGASRGKDASGNPTLTSITLSEGTQGIQNNFGEIKPGSLSGFVYNDSNNDGNLESGEPGIGGVSVTLTGTTANGQSIQAQTVTTNADGSYSFNNLLPGTYQITKQTPQNYIDGLANQPGSLGGTAVSDQVFSSIGLGANASGLNYNFGEILPGHLSGFVYDDASGNVGQSAPPAGTGIGGVTVKLMKGTQLIQTVTTKQDGSYDFFGLLPGTYSIAKVDTQGWAYIDDKVTVGTQQTGNATGNNINGITVASGTNGSFNNFSEVKGGTLSGTVYIDKNNTGVLQTGDKGVPGVRVTLAGTDANGNAVSLQTTTDANGFYQFAGLLGGDYTITKIPPAGYLDGMLQPTAGIVAGSPDGNVVADQFTNISLPLENSGDQYNFAELQLPSPPPNNPIPTPIPPPITIWNFSKSLAVSGD